MKSFYQREFAKITTSPLEPQSLRNLEQIYVHLLLREGNDDEQVTIDYDKLLEILSNGNEWKRRILFLGEAGVGKTTLLVKIAHDWASGNLLQHVELLFYIPLREIKECTCFSDISVIAHVCDEESLDTGRVNAYLKTNQRKVMFLLDGLDEYSGNMTSENTDDVLVHIMSGHKRILAPVIVTTRPWRADQITCVSSINKRYMRVRVEGYNLTDMEQHIRKFFKHDLESAKSLIRFIKKEKHVAENMALYPIFCCKLCHMWRRKDVSELQTFSQFLETITNALIEQLAAKVKETLRDCQTRCTESFKRIGEVAFRGLLVKEFSFSEEDFKDCKDALETGCELGILSSKKQVALMEYRDEYGSEYIVKVSFPHKLMQEYLAAVYLASLYNNSLQDFAAVIRDKVLVDYTEFRYLLYFTAALDKESGNAARLLMETLSQTIKPYDETLLVGIVSECHCHNKSVITPAIEYFRRRTSVTLLGGVQTNDKHTWSGYMYTFAACAQQLVNL